MTHEDQATNICPKCRKPYLRTIVTSFSTTYVHTESETRYRRRLDYALKWVSAPHQYKGVACTVWSSDNGYAKLS